MSIVSEDSELVKFESATLSLMFLLSSNGERLQHRTMYHKYSHNTTHHEYSE
jgi:hypothetical protein